MKLLLIEDNAAMQTTLQRSFERRGFRVSICDDGAKALSRWQAGVPDVVLLDLSMPGLDGLDVLAQARAQGLTTPVIIITARGTLGDKILGLNIGADDYLPKPFDLDELEARIRALVRRQGQVNGPLGRIADELGHLQAEGIRNLAQHQERGVACPPLQLGQVALGHAGGLRQDLARHPAAGTAQAHPLTHPLQVGRGRLTAPLVGGGGGANGVDAVAGHATFMQAERPMQDTTSTRFDCDRVAV